MSKKYTVKVTFGRSEEVHDALDAGIFAALLRPRMERIFAASDFSIMKVVIVNQNDPEDSFSETHFGERLKKGAEG